VPATVNCPPAAAGIVFFGMSRRRTPSGSPPVATTVGSKLVTREKRSLRRARARRPIRLVIDSSAGSRPRCC